MESVVRQQTMITIDSITFQPFHNFKHIPFKTKPYSANLNVLQKQTSKHVFHQRVGHITQANQTTNGSNNNNNSSLFNFNNNGNGNNNNGSKTYNVVITGSTKGIGYALAQKFLQSGDKIVVCSRSEQRVRQTVREFQDKFGEDCVFGQKCNVGKAKDVQELAKFAKNSFGNVDIWINNAGTNAYSFSTLENSDDDDIMDIVNTNVLGVMYGCREAIRVMKGQDQGGHIFNMDGAGAEGESTPRFAVYGATKRGLNQLSKSIEAELKMLNIDNVGIHNLSPGMVNTELLMSGADTPTAKFFINCLAETPDMVADFLVPRIRKVPQEARTLSGGVASGTYIRFLTRTDAYGKILVRLVTGKNKNRYVPED
eukprot:TRINITY_DN5522_c0_g1_i2.p1 TRINITY_DN5522_c0_g1~~TRINITY_DN5522_c0_g1_i2.p1  ORF type:complete len:377 (-),score=34.44 TRINITY_DN5522_c0_g1_i2:453-1559(-)